MRELNVNVIEQVNGGEGVTATVGAAKLVGAALVAFAVGDAIGTVIVEVTNSLGND